MEKSPQSCAGEYLAVKIPGIAQLEESRVESFLGTRHSQGTSARRRDSVREVVCQPARKSASYFATNSWQFKRNALFARMDEQGCLWRMFLIDRKTRTGDNRHPLIV